MLSARELFRDLLRGSLMLVDGVNLAFPNSAVPWTIVSIRQCGIQSSNRPNPRKAK